MKKFYIILLIIALLVAGSISDAQNRFVARGAEPDEDEPCALMQNQQDKTQQEQPQWHKIYREQTFGQLPSELPIHKREKPDIIRLEPQNKKQRNEEIWYEPDTVTLLGIDREVREIYIYNEKGLRDTIFHQDRWLSYQPELQTYARSIYSYNASNRADTLTGQVLLTDGTWSNYRMQSAAYDYNGNQTMFLSQFWNGQNWVNEYRYISEHEYPNNLITEYYQYWYNNEWVYMNSDYRLSYTYDKNNNQLTELSQRWINNNFENYKLKTSTYNENNLNDTIINQNWNRNENAWVNVDKSIYEYDEMGNTISFYFKKWENNDWQSYQISNFVYDKNNNMLNRKISFFRNEVWVFEREYIYAYNSYSSLLSSSLFVFNANDSVWINQQTSLYFFNDAQLLDSTLFQEREINVNKVIYQYENNNKINTLWKRWQNNEWANHGLTLYEYGEFSNCIEGTEWRWENGEWAQYYYSAIELTYNTLQSSIGGSCHKITASYTETAKQEIGLCDCFVFLESEIENQNSVSLSWTNSANNDLVVGYHVLRNEIQLTDVLLTEPTFSDENLPVGEYSYFVVFYFNNECDSVFSNNVVVTIDDVGINFEKNDEIVIYPNPTSGKFSVFSFQFSVENIEIFDIAGRLVFTPNPIEGAFDITHLPNGIYFVRIKTDNEIITKKIIKK
ncbi:MAG: T9SS type A sorting domain-containing protein [Marinilabiliaceae bacterium]|nr:T9SS type A sorting domain-containing protein [Marinilabiliaceae bacterium]